VKAVDAEGGVRGPLGHHVTDPSGSIGADQGDLLASLLSDQVEEAVERLLVPTDGRPHSLPES
jgi:hypothetical protein